MKLLAFKKGLCGFDLNASPEVMQEQLTYDSSPDLPGFSSLSFIKGRSENEIKINKSS